MVDDFDTGDAGAVGDEDDFQVPDWVYGETGTAPAATPAPQQQAAPARQPDRPWEAPVYDSDAILSEGSRRIDAHVRAYADRLAQAHLAEVEKRERIEKKLETVLKQQVSRTYRGVQDTIAGALKDFHKDPAFANKQVRETVEGYLRRRKEEARRMALEDLDFTGLEALGDRDFLENAFEIAKRKAGLRGGVIPGHVDARGAKLEGARRTAAPKPTAQLTEGEKEYCRLSGTSEADYAATKLEQESWDE